MGLLLVGGLITSEVLAKLSGGLKGLICGATATTLGGAVFMWSDEDTDDDKEDA